ncbi:MAG: AAA family ATPase [Nitrososphaerales archaeon]
MRKPRSLPTRIGITGSPGTGKKSVGGELAKISGMDLLLINNFLIENKLGVWRGEEYCIDLRRARGKIDTRGKVVCGHLLPYLVSSSKLDFVAVLRCSPKVLKGRYLVRNYSPKKITENLEAEMIGVTAEKAISVYGKKKVGEFDTTRTKDPRTVAKRIFETIIGSRPSSLGKLDWLSRQSPHSLRESLHD